MNITRLSEPCTTLHTHDDVEPSEMGAWLLWSADMQKDHVQHRCPNCHLYKVWLPRELADSAS